MPLRYHARSSVNPPARGRPMGSRPVGMELQRTIRTFRASGFVGVWALSSFRRCGGIDPSGMAPYQRHGVDHPVRPVGRAGGSTRWVGCLSVCGCDRRHPGGGIGAGSGALHHADDRARARRRPGRPVGLAEWWRAAGRYISRRSQQRSRRHPPDEGRGPGMMGCWRSLHPPAIAVPVPTGRASVGPGPRNDGGLAVVTHSPAPRRAPPPRRFGRASGTRASPAP